MYKMLIAPRARLLVVQCLIRFRPVSPITRLDHRGSHTRVASKFLQISPHVNTAHFICRHELGEELTLMWLF